MSAVGDATRGMSPAGHVPQRLTSFGFLPPEEDQDANQYGISGLLSSIKGVFGVSAPESSHPTAHALAVDPQHDPALAGPSNRQRQAPPRPAGPSNTHFQPPYSTRSANHQKTAQPRPPVLLPKVSSSQPRSVPRDGLPTTTRHRSQPSLGPISLAPAIASTASTHINALSHSVTDSQADFDDTRSIVAETILDNDDNTISREGVRTVHTPEPSATWTSIPGFPLSRDLLADDTQSIRSSPSKAQLDHRLRERSDASYNTSAEAFRRLTIRGGAAASKEWWMPDDLAKECSDCGAAFSIARRKHHCRCCGQIFCARCASNLLSGQTMGLSGLVRVCNFCCRMVQEYERARSGAAVASKLPDSGRGTDGRVRADMISAPLEATVENAPQGRFAANALFSAVVEDAIGDVATPSPAQAPFRKRLVDDDHITPTDSTAEGYLDQPQAEDLESPINGQSPRVGAYSDPDASPAITSTIAFPSVDKSPSKSLAKNALDEARAKLVSDASTNHESRARLVSDAAVRAFRRSRLRSRLNTNDLSDKTLLPGLRDELTESRPGSRLGNVQSLEAASLSYLRRLLQQCLSRASIGDKEQWLDVLLPLTLKVVGNLKPNAHGQGRMMGLRKYVKIKRIPGGLLGECSLLNGYICSHNVASKSMIRKLPLQSPRVALLSFSLTAVRGEGYYTSLDNLAASEREYTRILVARVLALRPHLLVVKSQVSRLALGMLEQAGVVVVWNIPDSAMDAIARVTQSDIITSVDRLALSPRLGRCGAFTVETYHSQFLHGKKRSFLQFTGTPKDLGCSIILRGGGRMLLGEIKSILELCLLTAHNLRLEEAMRDTDILSLSSSRPPSYGQEHKHSLRSHATLDGESGDDDADDQDAVPGPLNDYRKTLMSISAHIQIPPPYPLLRLQEERSILSKMEAELCLYRDRLQKPAVADPNNEKRDATSTDEQAPDDASISGDSKEASVEGEEKPLNAPSESSQPSSPTIGLDQSGDVEPQVASVLPSREEMSLKTRYALAQARHTLDVKLASSIDHKKILTPFAHQSLSVLHAVVSSATRKPCIGPRIEHMEFYTGSDLTLGNYLEIRCQNTSKICHAKDCGLQEILHYDAFIHNDVRIQLFCERFVCPIAGQEDSLLTWEFCKLCEAATPVSVVNDDAKAYSWAKLLEAHFYTEESFATCAHPKMADRIRYFAYKNLAFRIHVERIRPYEIVIPGLRLFMRPDAQSRLRSEESLALARRADSYFHSVGARLRCLEQEVALGRDGAAATERHRPALEELASCARQGRAEVNELLLSELKTNRLTDILFLSKVRRRLQEVVVNIDKLFVDVEKVALPKERDVRRLTSNHLSRMFAERDPNEKSGNVSGLPPAAEMDEHGGEGLPTAQPESSVAALARIADASALGIPQFGLGLDILSPAGSGSRTPTSNRKVSASERTSAAPTPRPGSPQNGLDLPRGTADGAEQAVEDSDGNSSPTTFIKAASSSNIHRPKPRRARLPVGHSATEDSCPDAGDVTDSHCTVSSLVHRFESPSQGLVKRPSQRPGGLASRSASARTVPKLQGRGDNDGKTSISRPTSPFAQRSRTPNPRANDSREAVPPVTLVTRKKSQSARQPPPSSYRAPSSQARASESESDAAGGAGRLRVTNSRANHQSSESESTAARSKTPMRRVSGSTDSRNESTIRAPRRRGITPVQTRTPSRVPIPSSDTRGRVSTIARHFDRINREAERERDRQKRALALRARRALPPSASTARVAEYTSVTAAVESDESSDEGGDSGDGGKSEADDGGEADSEDEDEGTIKRARAPLMDNRPAVPQSASTSGASENIEPVNRACTSPPPREAAANAVEKLLPHLSESIPATPAGDAERGSLLKTISSFWASRTGTSLPLLEYPLSAEQHLFADSPLLLREDEPSSVIAFTLVSNQYQERMRSLRAMRCSSQDGGVVADVDVGDASMASWNIVLPKEDPNEEVEATLRMPEGVHLRFDYESGASRFHCRILFSEQFAALRRCCGCEESLVASLARCIKWDSTGGKSGMTFLKTQDDRLVLKQLSSSELASFGTFAPHYFAHMAECLMHGKPTTLAKIFGLFRISMRNSTTGRSYKLDVVVMENLFYGRECTRIFDLKGSMRNRHVKETGSAGEVLLDENLVEISRQSPLYVRQGSKSMLKQALKHDSDFLADMNIMDYSVIVGLDQHELVVGIIDFLRSYTWDKRVETFVKEQSSLLAGGGAKGELPTVITPKQYAQRFLTFLDGVLLLSPDSWYTGTADM